LTSPVESSPEPKPGADSRVEITPDERTLIDQLVEEYLAKRSLVSRFLKQLYVALSESEALNALIHSTKYRLKEPEHLREKLARKIKDCKKKGLPFEINRENLLAKVTDLAGIRILHLYTRQFAAIDEVLREILAEDQYRLVEGPFARTWDDESREYFRSLGVDTQLSPNLYTSVHYVVESASRTKVTCEIQVRTLMEEVWGEVDHSINYPTPHDSLPCREQIKVLARVVSGATRLVDAIFATVDDHERTREQRG
jgi:ppGpp synthetase/RelA/SpoT-type nucleotidyltranferase